MKASIEAASGKCPFCPAKGSKEQPLFVVRSEVYNGRLCGEHLHALISQEKDPAAPESGPGENVRIVP